MTPTPGMRDLIGFAEPDRRDWPVVQRVLAEPIDDAVAFALTELTEIHRKYVELLDVHIRDAKLIARQKEAVGVLKTENAGLRDRIESLLTALSLAEKGAR